MCSGGDRINRVLAGRMTSNKLVVTRRQVRFRRGFLAFLSFPAHLRIEVELWRIERRSRSDSFGRKEKAERERERGKNGDGGKNVLACFSRKIEPRKTRNASFPFCVPRSSSSWLSSSKRPALILGARVGPSSLLLRCYFH